MRRRLSLFLITAATLSVIGLGLALGASARADILTTVHSVTARYQSIQQAIKAGYVEFYICTEQPGQGAMGQHFVKPALVGDPTIDPLQPEALVYEPQPNGGYKLVALEWVRIGPEVNDPPTVLGQTMSHVPSGNRYEIEPDGFYQRHYWLYRDNPSGTFADWNPRVSCGDEGDNGGG